jgi:hypothetical protein
VHMATCTARQNRVAGHTRSGGRARLPMLKAPKQRRCAPTEPAGGLGPRRLRRGSEEEIFSPRGRSA